MDPLGGSQEQENPDEMSPTLAPSVDNSGHHNTGKLYNHPSNNCAIIAHPPPPDDNDDPPASTDVSQDPLVPSMLQPTMVSGMEADIQASRVEIDVTQNDDQQGPPPTPDDTLEEGGTTEGGDVHVGGQQP